MKESALDFTSFALAIKRAKKVRGYRPAARPFPARAGNGVRLRGVWTLELLKMQGTRVGHFEVIDRIGEGGMGVVYKARDVSLNRLVALKSLNNSAADSERRQRFIQEAQAASALNHPNIVTIFEVFREGAGDFIAMELVAGHTLADLPPGRKLRIAEVVGIGEQIAAALATAHAAGIVHRDLKPSNVMLTPEGNVKVLDFGLAKLTERTPIPQSENDATQSAVTPRTEAGSIMGTAAYMSPEQAEGRPVDHRTDIFSFGSLLYELASGQRAFEGPSRIQIMAAVIEREPAPLQGLVASVPRELERLIGRCLKKNPLERPQSLHDVRHALQDIRADLSSGQVNAALPPPGAVTALPVPPARRRWWLLAAGAVAVAAAALGGLRLFRPPLPPPSFHARPLTTYPGSESHGTLSSDLRQIAFAWEGAAGDNVDIYIRNLASGDPLRLTSHPARDYAPSWTPAGDTILFLRDEPGGQPPGVYAIASLGGTERRVYSLGGDARGGPDAKISFTPDGKYFVVTDGHALTLVQFETGTSRKLELGVTAKGHMHPGAPAISPSGNRIAAIFSGASEGDSIYVAPLDTSSNTSASGNPRRLVRSRFGALSSVAWAKDGEALFYTDSREGPSRLFRIWADGGGGPAMAVPGIGDHIGQISTVADRLIYTYSYQDWNLWTLPVGPAARAGAPPQAFAQSTQAENSPGFSPDGKQVAFISERAGDSDIWVSAADGSQLRQLTKGASVRSAPLWSPDGTEILYSAFTDEGRGSYAVRADSGSSRRVGPIGSARPIWSLDGKSIYFTLGVGDKYRTYRLPAAGTGEPQPIHPREWSGMDMPLGETPDGSGFLVDTAAQGVVRVPLDGGSAPEPLSGAGPVFHGAFRGKGGLYYRDGQSGLLMHYRFGDGSRAQLGNFPPLSRDFAVSPDGNTLIFSRVDQRIRDLMIIEGIR